MDAAETSRRIAYVRNYFALEDQFSITWVLPETWDHPTFMDGAGPHFPLGFSEPMLVAGTGLVVFVCAEVLVAQTEALTQEQFFAFCGSVRLHLYLHRLSDQEATDPSEEAVLSAQSAQLGADNGVFELIWKGIHR